MNYTIFEKESERVRGAFLGIFFFAGKLPAEYFSFGFNKMLNQRGNYGLWLNVELSQYQSFWIL